MPKRKKKEAEEEIGFVTTLSVPGEGSVGLTGSWRIFIPELDEEQVQQVPAVLDLLPRGLHHQGHQDKLRLLQGLRHLRRGVPEQGDQSWRKKRRMRLVDTGNHVAAWGARLARVEVVSAYPITPQTQVIEEISRFIDEGEMDCEYIPVESEHSAMAAMIGSAAMGVRSFSATSSHGLAYMHELLHWAAGIRLPMVMVNVNRAMGPGWNIWCDHQDALAARDTGWIQLYCASHQEVLDTVIQAFRISEDLKVILPVMVCYDAIVICHSYMQVEVPEQEKVDRFLPPFRSLWKLDLDYPLTHGSVIYPDDYEEVRFSMFQGLDNARKVIVQAAEEYRDIDRPFPRRPGGDLPHGGRRLRPGGHGQHGLGVQDGGGRAARAGATAADVVRVRSYRPFPIEELREILLAGCGR